MAATTAALSGQTWTLRQGSLLDPVASTEFDQVVANPPFVVSPGFDAAHGGYDYRDSGLAGDGVSAALVRGIPRVLAPGGTASLLANWVVTADEPWSERVGGWLAGSGCDAWVWQREVAEPGEYIALWLRDAGEQPGTPQWAQRYVQWLDWFAAERVLAVGMGLVTLWRTDHAQPSSSARTSRRPSRTRSARGCRAGSLGSGGCATHGDDELLATRLRCTTGWCGPAPTCGASAAGRPSARRCGSPTGCVGNSSRTRRSPGWSPPATARPPSRPCSTCWRPHTDSPSRTSRPLPCRSCAIWSGAVSSSRRSRPRESRRPAGHVSARVVVDGAEVGAIGTGLLVLVGVTHGDEPGTAAALARKIHGLRILRGEASVADRPDAGVLVVSQFTLYGDARKGRRPTWAAAAPGAVAEPLVERVVSELRSLGATVSTGVFGADMAVESVNDGPVTVLLEL